VIETNPESPLRPKVKILIDPKGVPVERASAEVIDLEVEKKIFIVKAVDPATLGS
jgi:hypothetical protein